MIDPLIAIQLLKARKDTQLNEIADCLSALFAALQHASLISGTRVKCTYETASEANRAANNKD